MRGSKHMKKLSREDSVGETVGTGRVKGGCIRGRQTGKLQAVEQEPHSITPLHFSPSLVHSL